MAEFEFDYDDREGDEDEFSSEWEYGGKSGIVVLIDASKEMFEDGTDNEESYFIKALKCVHATVMRKIIGNSQDQMGIVLFNTKEMKNRAEFPNIYVLQELARPGANQVKEIEQLMEDSQGDFERNYGHSTSTSIAESLWVSQILLSAVKLSSMSILLFTCNDDPHKDDYQKQRNARKKAHDLQEIGIDLEILHMGESFEVNKFYKDLVVVDPDGEESQSQGAMTLGDPSTRFEELLERVRSVEHKRRTTGRVTFTLAPNVEMALSLYTSIRKMTKPTKARLYKCTNEEVRTMKKEFLEETGELLMPSDYIKYQIYGDKKIRFTPVEVKSLSRVYNPGMELLGFKPVDFIKPYYHIKPANFAYPDEKSIKGSTKLFAALLSRCMARKVVPIVRLVPRRGASVSWAALLPQIEEIDKKNHQSKPPGFHVCFLPFADDFRNIEIENSTRAESMQVDAAKNVIRKLHFKYNPEIFENPVLQTHWRNVEALALNRTSLEPVEDYTVPNNERIERKAGEMIAELKGMVYPDSYDPDAKKRPSQQKNAPAAKKPKPEPGNINMEDLAKKGTVNKLTMDLLKTWLQEKGENVKGKKKGQLVQDVYDVLGVVAP
ncbi:inverted repeat-binding protein [Oratosquilla oratoria]|uniref:inverted repeat-binding protein n=1 Tax=Oratosquilla oratoria TaxID=337810 RepID=UPI003F76898C